MTTLTLRKFRMKNTATWQTNNYIIKILLLLHCAGKLWCDEYNNENNIVRYSNTWVAKINASEEIALRIAKEVGFFLKQSTLGNFAGVYNFYHPNHPKKGRYENFMLTKKLQNYTEVLWAKQVSMVKRQVRRITCPRTSNSDLKSNYMETFNDVLWMDQWYMHDCRNSVDGSMYDLNIVPAYYKLHLTGYGTTVVIVDDGVETTHRDLRDNYDKSFGLDLVDNDDIPDPIHSAFHKYHHGTRCAGIIAMTADNKMCGAGIAPLATLGAVRLVSKEPSSDILEAQALSFKVESVDVFNNSWGPDDDGVGMPHMGELTRSAIKYGVQKGRHGKGTIYLFAGGNGKRKGDNCACDTFVSSIYTIAVGSVDELGRTIAFSERCTSIMVVTYSGDANSEYKVVTTDVNGECTREHTGTSASTPIVAGVLSLAFEINMELSWRDIQHLLAFTSEVTPLEQNYGWIRNQAGFYVSHDFGFGLLNGYNLLLLAKNFKSVPPMTTCVVPIQFSSKRVITRTKGLKVKFKTDGCHGLPAQVNYLEHVQLVINAIYTRRGDFQIILTSPQGTRAHLLSNRPKDAHTKIVFWPFDSVHTWGEAPQGVWTIEVFDNTGWYGNKGEVNDILFIIHGTKEMPAHYKNVRSYYELHLPQSHSSSDHFDVDYTTPFSATL